VRAACVRHESTKSPRSLSLGEKTAEIETKSGVTWYSCRASSCPLQLGGVWQRLLWLLWRRWACRRCDFCMHSATHELPRPFWVLQDWERAMQQTLLSHLPALARCPGPPCPEKLAALHLHVSHAGPTNSEGSRGSRATFEKEIYAHAKLRGGQVKRREHVPAPAAHEGDEGAAEGRLRSHRVLASGQDFGTTDGGRG
jgi:hypothetical protein